jgi:hypothetical protein
MATGAAPALQPRINNQPEPDRTPSSKPLSFKERLINTLSKIFEHNESQDVTRF